jgi:hypothetical protein
MFLFNMLVAAGLYAYLLMRTGVGRKAIVAVVTLNFALFVLLSPLSVPFSVCVVLVSGTLSYVACLPWKNRITPATIVVVVVANVFPLLLTIRASPRAAALTLLFTLTLTLAAYISHPTVKSKLRELIHTTDDSL